MTVCTDQNGNGQKMEILLSGAYISSCVVMEWIDLSDTCGRAKSPLKIKVWLWLIWYNAVATKDNMMK
jgi:hypothetical protein